MRCPTCREPMSFEPELQFIDCPAGHRASTHLARWHTATVYTLVAEIEAFLNPAERPTGHKHQWVTIEQTCHESLSECVFCSAWQIGPGGATTQHHGESAPGSSYF